ncbi:hypothetical protein [Flavobacterium sp. HJJ]|uniref:hypothetical protein n=1 Tax=Flavobacterium sp. HJJ TaxID=2783792 RepID=UPI00188B2627|nr:hypothetical protein [Flavobacterium sp. HJJ]MBF4471511.1 hypothetical protein [Flavobacterium sp. HJJ]
MILKTNFKIAILIFFFSSCNSQTKSNKVQEKQQLNFNLLGEWKLKKRLLQDEKTPLSQKESLECAGNITTFKINSFISPKDKCFGGYACSSPNYKIQKVNAYEYFENDSAFLELLGITKKYIEVITSDCGVPFNSIIILDKNNICYGMDGYEYFLEKVLVTSKLKKVNTINNPVGR